MAQKKRTTAKQQPVHTVTSGEVAVDIFLRQGNSGHRYLCMSPRKVWTIQATGKECSGTVFFEADRAALQNGIDQAYEWMRDENAKLSGQTTETRHAPDAGTYSNRTDENAPQSSHNSGDPSTTNQETDTPD